MHATQNQVTVLVTPARTLRDAAFYLSRYGWIQGCYFDPTATIFTPAADIVGAIGMVCYGGPSDTPALNTLDPFFPDFEEAMDLLCLFLRANEGTSDPYHYNDAKGRKVSEVIDALLDAADMGEDVPTWAAFSASMPLIIRAGLLPSASGGAA